VIIDKDNAPNWDPPTVDLVRAQEIDRYFAPLEGGDLDLG
jgi:enoyl-CoA hydratase